MTRLISRIALAAALVLALAVGSAMAEQVTGQIGFSLQPAYLLAADKTTPVADLNNAYAVQVWLNLAQGFSVADGGGAYAGIDQYFSPAVQLATIKFRNDDGTLCTDIDPDITFGTVGGFTFTLDTLSGFNPWVEDNGKRHLDLNGYGRVSGNGYEETLGEWVFGARFNSGATAGTWDANFTSPVNTPTVPEPTTLVLLGTGLLGAAVLARRNRKQ